MNSGKVGKADIDGFAARLAAAKEKQENAKRAEQEAAEAKLAERAQTRSLLARLLTDVYEILDQIEGVQAISKRPVSERGGPAWEDRNYKFADNVVVAFDIDDRSIRATLRPEHKAIGDYTHSREAVSIVESVMAYVEMTLR